VEQAAAQGAKTNGEGARTLRTAALWGGLLAVLLVLPFLTSQFFVYYMVIVGINLILVVSLDIVLGYAGLMSLMHAGFWGVGAYASAVLSTRYGWPFLGGVGVGMVVCAILGGLVAYPSTRLKGHSFVVMTFVSGLILNVLFNDLESITRGPRGIPGIPLPQIGIPGGFSYTFFSYHSYFYLVLFFLALLIVVKQRLVHSRFGHALLAIRSNEDLARSVGVNTVRYKIQAFAVSAAFAGLAGSLYAHFLSFIGPETFTFVESFELFVMNFVGGRGSLAGPIIGTVFLSYFKEAARNFSPVVANLSFGVLLLLTIGFFPAGIVGAWRKLMERWRR